MNLNLNTILLISTILAVLFLFVYIFIREKVINRKFQRIAMAIEEINEEIDQLEKKQKNTIKKVEEKISTLLSENGMIDNLNNNIQNIIYKNEEEIILLYKKIEKLENQINHLKLNNLSSINIEPEKKDEEQVKELFKAGYSIEDISKELNIPAGQVKFILKF